MSTHVQTFGDTKVRFANVDGVKEPFIVEYKGRQISIGQFVEVCYTEGDSAEQKLATAKVERIYVEGMNVGLCIQYFTKTDGVLKVADWPINRAPIESVTRIFAR